MSKPTPEIHVFVCTNGPEKKGKCGGKGAELLRKKLKELSQKMESEHRIRINASGCLGQCSRGIACVVYPHTKWFFDLKEKDSKEILAYLQEIQSDPLFIEADETAHQLSSR